MRDPGNHPPAPGTVHDTLVGKPVGGRFGNDRGPLGSLRPLASSRILWRSVVGTPVGRMAGRLRRAVVRTAAPRRSRRDDA